MLNTTPLPTHTAFGMPLHFEQTGTFVNQEALEELLQTARDARLSIGGGVGENHKACSIYLPDETPEHQASVFNTFVENLSEQVKKWFSFTYVPPSNP